MDNFIQDNFFNEPWQIATVYDPHADEEGTFFWRGGKSERESILTHNDTGRKHDQVAQQTTAAPDSVADLTKRVRRLERRLDILLTGFLVLVLIALAGPLIFIAFNPDMQ